jgi:hypothetical protein
MPLTTDAIGVMLSIVTAAVTIALWITGRLSKLEQTIFKALRLHEREDNIKFREHDLDIRELQLHSFGFQGRKDKVTAGKDGT